MGRGVNLGGGLVQYQHVGAAGQGQGQEAALVFAAAQCERIRTHDPRRLGELQARQQFLQLAFVKAAAFADLPADGQHRIEAGRGILRGVKQFTAANARPGRGRSHLPAAEKNPAAADAQLRRQKAGQGAGQQRLAGAALPEQDGDPAGRYLQVNPAQQRQRPGGWFLDPEALRLQHARQARERRTAFNPPARRWLRSRPRLPPAARRRPRRRGRERAAAHGRRRFRLPP